MSGTESLLVPTTDTPFRSSYPIGFDLYDDDDQNVLYIDSVPKNLHFSVWNASAQTVEFPALEGDPSKENYHLELKFRPGTLANWEKIALAESDDWKFNVEEGEDKTISLYFLSTDAVPEIAPQKQLDFTLQKVSADGGGGARGTRAELKYRNLRYASASAADSENLEGTRIQHLSIVNQQGRKDVPLYVGFTSSNNVLNDGASANQLDLKIANASSEPVSLEPSNDANPKFILSFDSGDATWALGTKDQVQGIKVKVRFPGSSDWQDVSASDQSDSPQWEIEIPERLKLDAQNLLELQLSNIVTDHQSGYANLYVRYENIPGYSDGQLVSAIEKAPLLYNDLQVGIGTNNPAAKLHVKGILYADGGIGIGTAVLQETEKLKIVFKDSDTVNFVRDGSNSESNCGGLQFVCETDGWSIQTTEDAQKLYLNYDSGGDVYIKGGKKNPVLFVGGTNGLSVGIGTDKEEDLKGALNVKGAYYGEGDIRLYGKEIEDETAYACIQAVNYDYSSDIGLKFTMQCQGQRQEVLILDPHSGGLEIKGNLVLGDAVLGGAELKYLTGLVDGKQAFRLYSQGQGYLYVDDEGNVKFDKNEESAMKLTLKLIRDPFTS